jgi:hypothetical protein
MNRKFPANTKLLLIIAIALILSSCKSNSKTVVFFGQCVFPCWRGIDPGETHFQDALNMIKKFPDYDSKRTSVSDAWNIFSNFIDFELKTGENIRVYAIDDVVVLITFYNPRGITFEDCINNFGSPMYAAQYAKLGAGPIYLPMSEGKHVWFAALNPQQGVVFSYDTYGNFELKPKATISEISFFDTRLYEKLFENAFIIRFDPANNFMQEKLYVWKDYGNINELYPEK